MNLLICAATFAELNPILRLFNAKAVAQNRWQATSGKLNFTFLITGVSYPFLIYNLTKSSVLKNLDFALNIGLCGAFPQAQIPILSTVNITTEIMADLGVEDRGVFRSVFEIGLVPANSKPFEHGTLKNPLQIPNIDQLVDFNDVRSITVCTASGETNQIRKRWEKYQPQVENMEGAGFFYVMLQEGIPFLEIRTVSNLVEPRDKSRWRIAEALKILTQRTAKILQALQDGQLDCC